MAMIPTPLLIEELKRSKGMVATAARNIGLSRTAFYNRINGRGGAGLREVLTEEREIMTDKAETKLYDAIEAGSETAIKFYLATQGRGRGYVQRTETALTSDGKRLEFTLNIGEPPPGERDGAE